MAETLSVRPAHPGDADWLYGLHESAHRDLVEQAYGPWQEEQQRGFFAPLLHEHEVFVLMQDEQPIGAVYLGQRDADTWLELIEVGPARQGQGYGTHLLDWVVQRSGGAGRAVLLQVHKINEGARRLYLRNGFVPAGETATHHLLRRAVQR